MKSEIDALMLFSLIGQVDPNCLTLPMCIFLGVSSLLEEPNKVTWFILRQATIGWGGGGGSYSPCRLTSLRSFYLSIRVKILLVRSTQS